jgi:hypothetical protein
MPRYSALPPSQQTGEKCQMVVRNRSHSVLRLLWLTFDHSPVEYARIAANAEYAQPTYSTHTWVVEDLKGNTWAHFQGMLPAFKSSRVLGCMQGGLCWFYHL